MQRRIKSYGFWNVSNEDLFLIQETAKDQTLRQKPSKTSYTYARKPLASINDTMWNSTENSLCKSFVVNNSKQENQTVPTSRPYHKRVGVKKQNIIPPLRVCFQRQFLPEYLSDELANHIQVGIIFRIES